MISFYIAAAVFCHVSMAALLSDRSNSEPDNISRFMFFLSLFGVIWSWSWVGVQMWEQL